MVTVFCIALKEHLSQNIQTSVYIDYDEQCDTLTITIHSYLKPFRYTLPDISIKIVKGLEPSHVSNDVLKVYKKYVLKYFFK